MRRSVVVALALICASSAPALAQPKNKRAAMCIEYAKTLSMLSTVQQTCPNHTLTEAGQAAWVMILGETKKLGGAQCIEDGKNEAMIEAMTMASDKLTLSVAKDPAKAIAVTCDAMAFIVNSRAVATSNPILVKSR